MLAFTCNDDVLTIFVKGEIDHHSSQALREDTDNIIKTHNPIKTILDFKGVTFCDSSGIAYVLGRYKLMTSLGGILELSRLTRQVGVIFDLANIRSIIKITN